MKLADAVAQWHLRNASLRHGHLPDATPPIDASPSGRRSALPALALAALAGGAGPLAAWWFAGRAPASTDPPPAAVAGDSQPGSLYQFLEDQNLHLPEAP